MHKEVLFSVEGLYREDNEITGWREGCMYNRGNERQ